MKYRKGKEKCKRNNAKMWGEKKAKEVKIL